MREEGEEEEVYKQLEQGGTDGKVREACAPHLKSMPTPSPLIVFPPSLQAKAEKEREIKQQRKKGKCSVLLSISIAILRLDRRTKGRRGMKKRKEMQTFKEDRRQAFSDCSVGAKKKA